MTGSGTLLTERRIRWALVAFTAVLPLAVWPGIERPFSSIKLQLLAIVVPAALVAAGRLGLLGRPRLPLAMDIALIASGTSLALSSITGPWTSLPALALAALGLGWFWVLMAFRPEVASLLQAVAVSGAVMAAVVVLQFVGLDPFRYLGWMGPEYQADRMRLFSTLGNPNFVAAFLAGVLPVQFSMAIRRPAENRGRSAVTVLACGLSLLALGLTGSRSAYLGLGLALVWSGGSLFYSEWRRETATSRSLSRSVGFSLFLVVAIVLVAVVGSLTRNPRPIQQAIEGRTYLWTIAAGHIREYVGAGLGPGSFAQLFPAWEAAAWQAGHFDEAKRQFVSVAQDHAHNEYLEFLVEQGIAGLISFVGLLIVFFSFAGRRGVMPAAAATSSAGVAALAGVAVTDFPFHRPAELFLFWTLVAAAFLSDEDVVGRRSSFAAPGGAKREAR
jgi:O-antigen ligase